MTPAASPFDQLLRHAAGKRPRRRAASLVPPDRASTKVGTALAYLREAGPASTLTLCHLLELESRLVWGLLKAPRERGQVVFVNGRWAAVDGYDAQLRADLTAAARLLRANGYRVLPPGSHHD